MFIVILSAGMDRAAPRSVMNAGWKVQTRRFPWLWRTVKAPKRWIAKNLWSKTLGKPSQKARATWGSDNRLLTVFPLLEPVIHQTWHR